MKAYWFTRIMLIAFIVTNIFWISNVFMEIPMTRSLQGDVTKCQILHSDTTYFRRNGEIANIVNIADIYVVTPKGTTKTFKNYRLTQFDDGDWQSKQVNDNKKFYLNNWELILFMSILWMVSGFTCLVCIIEDLWSNTGKFFDTQEERSLGRRMRYDHALWLITFLGIKEKPEYLKEARDYLANYSNVRPSYMSQNVKIPIPSLTEAIEEIYKQYDIIYDARSKASEIQKRV